MFVKNVCKKVVYWSISFALLLTSATSITTYGKTGKFTANAMAPLYVTNWNQFKSDLNLAKQMGIQGISVDVWWGNVEGEKDNQFDFSYYDQVFAAIKAADLEIIPIMSFHQCGGNVGDDYNVYLPNWIWTKYEGQSIRGEKLSSENLKYKSSQGNYSSEYIALWADEVVKNEYIDFMNAFEDHYGEMYREDIEEINISGGPSGELRYPSYNSHDKDTGYPSKGAMQCYSDLAQVDFRTAMLEKYKSLEGINRAWNCNLTNINEVTPPMDGDYFFYNNGSHSYYESQYGKDLLAWYNGALVTHGKNMLTYAETAFDEELDHIKLGIKIPGVHWQMASDTTPRAAEVCAGIINSDFSESNGYGYNPILKMISSFNGRVVLHFTCLEMNDYAGNNTSTPKTLVAYVGDSAAKLGVEIKGENALSGGNDAAYFWNNIEEAVSKHHYNGVTILRLRDVVEGQSYNYYKRLIETYRPSEETDTVNVNFKVKNAQTYWGQNVYIVGSIKALGEWNVDKAVILTPTKYSEWEVSIGDIPAYITFEFKFIKKDASGTVIWESGNNHVYTTGGDGGTFISIWQ